MNAALEERPMEQVHAYGEVAQIFGWLDGSVPPPKEAIVEGSAGGGKTYLIGQWIKAVCNMYPDSKGLVLRDTRVSLNESFLDIWENHVLGANHPAVLGGPGRMNRQSYKHPALGAEVVLGGMDNPTKIFSTEYSWIFFNECQQTTKVKWESLHRALRRVSSMPFRVLIGDCNPEDEFHWANQRMLDGKCQRIVSRLWDNPLYYDHENARWTELGIDYATRLCENLSGVIKERLYFGRWVSASGLVWPDYDPRVHILDGSLVEIEGRFLLEVEKWPEPVELVYFVGGQDIGHSVPGSAQVYGCDREGRMYLVAQIHQTEKDHDWWAQRWVEFNDEFPIKSIICDHDMAFIASLNRRIRGRGEDGMPGIARPANKMRGKGQEKVGIDDVRVRMKQRADGTRGWYILRNALRWGRDPKCIANGWPTCLEQEIPAWRYPDAADGRVLRDEPDPSIRDDACLVAGTLVETPNGRRAIETIAEGDDVLTHAGVGRVSAAGMTGINVPTVRVDFEGGHLVGTPEHPVWTARGWVRLDSLTQGDMLCAWSAQKSSSTEAASGVATRTASARRTEPTSCAIGTSCIAAYGPTTAVRSRRGCTSTIETRTPPTTRSETWSFSLPPSTRASTGPRNAPEHTRSASTEFGILPQRGTAHRKASVGTSSTQGTARLSESRSARSASSVERGTSRRILGASARTTASRRGGARPGSTTSTASARTAASDSASIGTPAFALVASRVLAISKDEPADVYNLTVDGQHTYFAGGVLVSNCDCTRYIAQFLRDRTFGIKSEGLIFPKGSVNDRLGYNKFFRRNRFRFDDRRDA